MGEIKSKPFVFDKGGFRNGSQTIVIDFNEAVRARCGKLYSYEQVKNEIIPFEIEDAKTPYGKINGGPPYWLAGPSAYTATKYIVGTLDCGVDTSAGFEGVLRKPPFDSFEALVNSVGLVPYNDKKSEQLILCNNFEQEIDGAWEVTLNGNPNGLATALDMLSRGENANPVFGLILRKEDRFAWIAHQLDISRHTFYEQQSASPVANEAPKVVGIGSPKTPPTSRNSITPLVIEVRKNCVLPNDLNAVWNALINVAQQATPRKPVRGFVPDEGIQYEGKKFFEDEGFDIYSKEALRAYINRNPL